MFSISINTSTLQMQAKMGKGIKDAYTVTATMLMNQPKELEEVQVLVAQHRRFVNWCAWGERENTFSKAMHRRSALHN